VIADEAHYLKNPLAMRTRALLGSSKLRLPRKQGARAEAEAECGAQTHRWCAIPPHSPRRAKSRQGEEATS
jgi:hypothetical protein